MEQDTQKTLLYVVKLVRFGFILVALYLAKTIYVNKYNDVVYVQKKAAPSILQVVGFFVLVDFVMNAVLWTILYYISWLELQKNPDFVLLNDVFFTRVLTDYVFSTALMASVGCLLGAILQRRWPLEGASGAQIVVAYKQMLLAICGFALIPQYYLLTG
jgi:hypothetical protein